MRPLGSLVIRLIIAFVSLIALGVAGWFTFIFGVTPVGMASAGCAQGPNRAVNLYTAALGAAIAPGAVVPPALLLFLKRGYRALISLGVFAVLNLLLVTAQFWFPMSYCR